MRARDANEVFAVHEHDDPLRLAYEATHMIRNKGRGTLAWHNGRPAAVGAFVELRPGVWEVMMFGTDAFKAVVFEMMRWVRTEAADILKHCKGQRLQCHARADYDEAHKMIRAMGGVQEGVPLRRFGKDGSDFVCFVWLRGENDAVLDPHYQRPKEA